MGECGVGMVQREEWHSVWCWTTLQLFRLASLFWFSGTQKGKRKEALWRHAIRHGRGGDAALTHSIGVILELFRVNMTSSTALHASLGC